MPSLLARIAVVSGGLAVLPLTISRASHSITVNDALCDGGTCCYEYSSYCQPDGCNNVDCLVYDHYWRNDGKKCKPDE